MEKSIAPAITATEMSEKSEPDQSALEKTLDEEKIATIKPQPVTVAPPVPEEVTPKKQRVIMCLALALGVFLISIDETVIVTAIPRITDDFHTIQDVGWYGSA